MLICIQTLACLFDIRARKIEPYMPNIEHLFVFVKRHLLRVCHLSGWRILEIGANAMVPMSFLMD